MPNPTQAELNAIHSLVIAARAAVHDAIWPYSLSNGHGHLAIGREAVEKLVTALKAYDDATILKEKAVVRATISDGEGVILELHLIISPDQAHSLTDSILSRLEKKPKGTSPAVRRSRATVKTIRFSRVNDRYGCFSNFAPYPIRLKGKIWPTVEHYFQAQKFAGSEYEDAIRLAISPAVAAHMGRDRAKPIRLDWDEVKNDIMREAVLAKFTQHTKLRERLLDTGDAILVEHTRRDRYWGDGGDGHGKNMIGRILMGVRDQLKQPKQNLGEPL